jgi:DNA-binding CsgD family transcriptional regulator
MSSGSSRFAHDPAGPVEASPPGHESGLDSAGPEVAVLLAVSRALTTWDSFESGTERLLADLAEALGLAAGALWLPQEDVLVARAIWSTASVDRAAFDGALRLLQLPRGTGLPGAAWEQRVPIQRISAHDFLPPPESALGDLHATVALPAVAGEEVLGVVELYSASQAEFSERLMRLLAAVGQVLGPFLARRRGQLELSPLTRRELEVLTFAAQGLAGPMIAEQLSISPATVKTHLAHVYAKLQSDNRTAAVAYALRAGLID